MIASGRPAVFLDRDDTLMVNVPYLGDPSKVRLFPGTREALDRLREAGFHLFIVSNQSGVGRGLITQEQVRSVNEEMIRQIGANLFDGIYNCYATPEDPDEGGERKPAPGLVLKAAREHGVNLAESYMVGDRLSDVECGRNAGCRSVLVLTSEHGRDPQARQMADHVAENLPAAAEWICNRKRQA